MKSQSFKLFAIAFVLGLVTVFGAVSASAQTRSTFETSFEFHVGKEKLSAGKYEIQRIDYGKYVLRNLESNKSRIVYFDLAQRNTASEEPQRVLFNRYGSTYFLRSLFEEPGSEGRQMTESSYEKQVRKGAAGGDTRLADNKKSAEKVSLKLSK